MTDVARTKLGQLPPPARYPLPEGVDQLDWDWNCHIADVLDWRETKREIDYIDVRKPVLCKERQGWVYFIGDDEGPVKIGFTGDLKGRLARLSASSPRPLRILASRPGSPFDERSYHLRFINHRRHGEWFSRHAEIIAEIDRLNALRHSGGIG